MPVSQCNSSLRFASTHLSMKSIKGRRCTSSVVQSASGSCSSSSVDGGRGSGGGEHAPTRRAPMALSGVRYSRRVVAQACAGGPRTARARAPARVIQNVWKRKRARARAPIGTATRPSDVLAGARGRAQLLAMLSASAAESRSGPASSSPWNVTARGGGAATASTGTCGGPSNCRAAPPLRGRVLLLLRRLGAARRASAAWGASPCCRRWRAPRRTAVGEPHRERGLLGAEPARAAIVAGRQHALRGLGQDGAHSRSTTGAHAFASAISARRVPGRPAGQHAEHLGARVRRALYCSSSDASSVLPIDAA